MNALASFFEGLGGLLKGEPDAGDVHVAGGPARGGADARRRKKPPMQDDEDKYAAEWSLTGAVAKADEAKQIVFGWASVVNKAGEVVTDSQGDQIDLPALEDAVYSFMHDSREAGEMHQRVEGVGKVVESLMVTDEKLAAMGLPAASLPHGWWVGIKLASADDFAKVKDGRYPMFSIGGSGLRETIE